MERSITMTIFAQSCIAGNIVFVSYCNLVSHLHGNLAAVASIVTLHRKIRPIQALSLRKHAVKICGPFVLSILQALS